MQQQIRLSYNHPVKELVWCITPSQSSANNHLWNFTTDLETSNIVLATNGTGVDGPISYMTGGPFLSNASVAQFSEEAVGPLTSTKTLFKLVLNGQDRFKEQDGKFFNQMQPFWHHTGNPYPGVYCYSFGLKPEEHQPTGTCNFSRIDNAQVQYVSTGTQSVTTLGVQDMYAVNYNILKIQSGLGGIAFSN
jgi:hypothetical protein